MQDFTPPAFGSSDELIDRIEATVSLHRMIAQEITADARLAWAEATFAIARSHRLMSAVERRNLAERWPPYRMDNADSEGAGSPYPPEPGASDS